MEMISLKKIFLNNWFYYFTALILSILFIGVSIVMVVGYFVSLQVNNPSGAPLLIIMVFYVPTSIFCEYIILSNFVQWTIVTKDNVYNRNMFGIIRSVSWNEIEAIKKVDANFSIKGSKLKWICLYDDETDIKLSNGIGRKNSFIMIRYTLKIGE